MAPVHPKGACATGGGLVLLHDPARWGGHETRVWCSLLTLGEDGGAVCLGKRVGAAACSDVS